jgi:hypothetical protein
MKENIAQTALLKLFCLKYSIPPQDAGGSYELLLHVEFNALKFVCVDSVAVAESQTIHCSPYFMGSAFFIYVFCHELQNRVKPVPGHSGTENRFKGVKGRVCSV